MRTSPHHSKTKAASGKAAVAASPARLLRVLLGFSPDEPNPTAATLARAADVPLSTVYRYLTLLRAHGLVADSASRTYHLTPRLYALAEAARRANPIEATIAAALVELRDRTGECALFIRRIGDYAVCTQIAEAAHPIRLSFTLGHPMPLDGGAGAKLLLATMPTAERSRYVAAHVAAGRRKRLLVELDALAAQSWATSESEVDDGVWAAAATTVHTGAHSGVISIAGPAFRLDAAMRNRAVASVREVAQRLA